MIQAGGHTTIRTGGRARKGGIAIAASLALALLMVLTPSQALAATYGPEDTYYSQDGTALASENGGDFNSAFGQKALTYNSTGRSNVAVGDHALQSNTTQSYSTAVGAEALESMVGDSNTATGFLALQCCYGSRNTADGFDALSTNGAIAPANNDNTAVGYQALDLNAGNYNTAIGEQALFRNSGLFEQNGGSRNTAGGYQSLYSNTTGGDNAALGQSALYGNTTGNNNVAIGSQAGSGNTTGFANIFIGAGSGPDALDPDLHNATAIGENAAVGESDALVLGGMGVNAVKVGIGTDLPDATLTVAGTIESTSGGIKFPDGTVQTTAASGASLPNPGAAGTVLRSDGASWSASGIQFSDLPDLSGGYLSLSGNQTVGGTKTFTSTIQGDISGNAGSVTNGLYSTGSYANPSWLTSLAGGKVTGSITGNAGGFTGSLSGDVSGGQGSTSIGKLQGYTLDLSAAPATNQLLLFNGSKWVAGNLPAGSNSYLQNQTGQAQSAGFNISGNGTVGGSLQVGNAGTSYGKYLQIPLVSSSSTPPAADCSSTTGAGRLVIQYNATMVKTTLWSCSPAGVWTKLAQG
jgi:hypothetical protein